MTEAQGCLVWALLACLVGLVLFVQPPSGSDVFLIETKWEHWSVCVQEGAFCPLFCEIKVQFLKAPHVLTAGRMLGLD